MSTEHRAQSTEHRAQNILCLDREVPFFRPIQVILYVIVPCFNEEEALPQTAPLFLQKLEELIKKEKISDKSRILFVDDGSRDKTWAIISSLVVEDRHYLGISQSRNRGHQNALLAGLMESKDHCDITISIDCDGQNDVRAMDDMIDAYLDGCEIVYGVRRKRDTDSFFKRLSAEGFYKLLNWMGAEVIPNHADYRLISSRVLQELAKFKEVNIFLRGMLPLVGFKSTSVYYDCHERIAGESRYPLKKMLGLALDGITSLSAKPIHLILGLGGGMVILSFLEIFWAVVMHFLGKTESGWPSIVCLICLLGGVQLLCLGVIGEYVGRIYLETKRRPRYILKARAGEFQANDHGGGVTA